jgi:general stress protein CsbA
VRGKEVEPSRWAFKAGLFAVLLVWFGSTVVQVGRSLITGVDVPYTDIPGAIGLSFRTAAVFVAIITVLFYLVKRGFSRVEVVNTFRWLVLFEAGYFVLFLPSAIWGLQYSSVLYSREFFIIEAGLPCLVEALVMPTVLVVLFFKLKANAPVADAIKWGLIAASANVFVIWFNYTAQWWSDIYLHGVGFLGQSHLYLFEFALTVGGLLFLAIYTAVYAKNSAGTQTLAGLDLRRAGAILTALGLYFDVLVVLWVLFGDVSFGRLTVWPVFSVLHNVDIWMAALPLVGVPLMFSRRRAVEEKR